MPARYNLAKRKAAELLKAISVDAPPVPVEELALHAGATIKYEPYHGQMSAMVHRQRDGSAVIGVNVAEPRTRRRFSIAHEIGHLMLHKDEELHIDERFPIGFRDRRSSLATDEKEIEANQFAAELLMPPDFVVAAIRDLPREMETDDAIAELADRFDVSVQSMTIRLSSLNILK